MSSYYIGEHLPSPGSAVSFDVLDKAASDNYNMISANITNINFETKVRGLIEKARSNGRTRVYIPGLEAEDVNIHPDECIASGKVIGVTSSWIELDSLDPLMASASRQVLHHEIGYAGFCGLGTLLVEGPKTAEKNIAAYCQAVVQGLAINAYLHINIILPAFGPSLAPLEPSAEDDAPFMQNSGPDVVYDEFTSWDIWNSIRTAARYTARLGLALQIQYSIPKLFTLNRWFAEPIRYLLIDSSAYLLNAKGYPVLTPPHQNLVRMYARKNPYYLLSNVRNTGYEPEISNDIDFPPLVPTTTEESKGAKQTASIAKRRDDPESYRKYLFHLLTNMPPPPPLDSFGAGYQDFLQSPLQPLADNLESMTYEVFEKDPVKYDQYEKAVKLALEDMKAQGIENICVAVVGAGRGPLVTRCIRAATNASVDIQMFAIEKNPNAYVHLMKMNRDVWDDRVTLVKTDMRKWEPPSYLHILVSELLGSFADNELSPECLDGVQRVLHPTVGISIPQSYTAHFAPIMAPKIHGDLLARAVTNNPTDVFEVPYVVMLTAIDFLSVNLGGEPNIHQAWEFKHPVPTDELEHEGGFNDHNQREGFAVFPISRRGVIHGIAGYFECVLYQNETAIVELSTRPDTIDAKSKDMISWFAIYFPLKSPMAVPDNSEAQVSFWRNTDGRKVWYDWMVETFGFIYEPTGASTSKIPSQGVAFASDQMATQGGFAPKRVQIAVSDILSSKKNGCLM
ncbi:hypothetical protein H072_11565 [Dactylellina haptotyla CBS 200.50]|uniref:Protein arginine N-methyltransferase n=1 Tax=Dactylellina haptotyla (strain CBS 200.50) TaxID=1284197 RepID=S7ZXF2_DACHA|nr:hypothetical protein H072_11565 [Dactylellina haptotyla CBS 200.50]